MGDHSTTVANGDYQGVKIRIEMCENRLNAKDREFIRLTCQRYDNDSGELVGILHAVQQHFGFLPPIVQQEVANSLSIPVSKVFGVVTFYSLFTMKPKGRHPINVCTGTACHVRGAQMVLDEMTHALGIKVGETTPDGKFSLSCLRCVGACGLAPVVMVGEKIYARVTPNEVRSILDSYV